MNNKLVFILQVIGNSKQQHSSDLLSQISPKQQIFYILKLLFSCDKNNNS